MNSFTIALLVSYVVVPLPNRMAERELRTIFSMIGFSPRADGLAMRRMATSGNQILPPRTRIGDHIQMDGGLIPTVVGRGSWARSEQGRTGVSPVLLPGDRRA